MQAAMQARIASGEAARGLSEPARERLQGALDFTQSAIPALEIAVRGLERVEKRDGAFRGDVFFARGRGFIGRIGECERAGGKISI